MPHRNLYILLLTAVASYVCYDRADRTPYSRHLAAAFRAIYHSALENPPDRALFDSAMMGMVAELQRRGDEHSEYIVATRAAHLDADIRQEFGGIGAVISLRGETEPRELVVLSHPEPGTPAARHDIRPGDRILAVDGKLISDLNPRYTEDILSYIRGPVGKPVRLTILHPGETQPVDIEIVRDVISLESVKGVRRRADGSWQFVLDDHPRLGYVGVTTFGEKTPQELTATLQGLTASGLEGLILDLRENPGGALDQTIQICDMFLDGGKTIVQTRDRRARVRDVYQSAGHTLFPDLPLAVLVNRNSASASEILAACLQDHGRAVVIGERTFGKGTVQQLLAVGPPMQHNQDYQSSFLKLTTSSYWRPSGQNIHRMRDNTDEEEWGVSPDKGMEVKLNDHQYLAFRHHLRMHELFNPNGDAIVDDPEKLPPEVQALLPFEDEALTKAVEYLQRK